MTLRRGAQIRAALLAAGVGAIAACAQRDALAVQARISACDSISKSLAVGKRSVRTLFSNSMLTDPLDDATPWRRGCALSLVDSIATPGIQPRVDALNQWFDARKWTPVLRYSADGPDGTSFAFRREAVLCVVRGQWDGGDDADSTYVPDPGSRWMIRCVPLAASDTTGG